MGRALICGVPVFHCGEGEQGEYHGGSRRRGQLGGRGGVRRAIPCRILGPSRSGFRCANPCSARSAWPWRSWRPPAAAPARPRSPASPTWWIHSTSTSSRSSRTAASSATVRTTARARPACASTRKDAALRHAARRAIAPSCRAARRRASWSAASSAPTRQVMMPAPDSHLTLTEVEKATLVRWIEQGAEWKPHWAFMPPTQGRRARRSTTRLGPRARSTASSWPRSRQKGCTPSPEAPRETLIRRVTFDLTGLPPTLAEVDAFLADRRPTPTSASSTGCSPAPRTASAWPPTGSTSPATPTRTATRTTACAQMWPWRDWVIGAFNRNLPFDQFITEQLAGDLLPDADARAEDRDRLQPQPHAEPGRRHRPGGVPHRVRRRPREHDRPRLPRPDVECARCHDHKYDPITQKEFYRLFASSTASTRPGRSRTPACPSPTLVLLDEPARARLAARSPRRCSRSKTRPRCGIAVRRAATTRVAGAGRPQVPCASRSESPASLAHLPLDGAVPVIEPEGERQEAPKELTFAKHRRRRRTRRCRATRIASPKTARKAGARRSSSSATASSSSAGDHDKTPPDKRSAPSSATSRSRSRSGSASIGRTRAGRS